MQFAYEAMRPDGTTVSAQLSAADRAEALDALRDKGMIVLRIEEAAENLRRGLGLAVLNWQSQRVTSRDIILLTRQMKMLLEAGAAVVPALEAAHAQTRKPVMRAILARIKDRVEQGETLSAALEAERQHFDAVFRSMVAAGEATASLPEIFGRLAMLTHQQQQVRKMVQGALIYPAILCVLLTAVVVVLLLFVVPRFETLFGSMGSELPATTEFLLGVSKWFQGGWPYVLAGGAVVVGSVGSVLRITAVREYIDGLLLRLPLIGNLMSRLIVGRIIRVWAAMLRCHIPLLEAIDQSRYAVNNRAFLARIATIKDAVAGGGRVGESIGAVGFADPIIASAISTGEENGRLAEAVDFVSTWIDEDNGNLVHNVTRMAEPLLLAVMGVIVGFVALALFLPLFDLATGAV